MKVRIADMLVGIFILGLGGVLIAGVLWFSATRPGQKYDEYLVYMQESVSGLGKDSAVKYYGVDVGRVHQISLGAGDPQQVRLLLQLDQGTPVTQGTVATLESQGLTGLAYINLHGRIDPDNPLQPSDNEAMPVIPSVPSVWGRLDQTISTLAENLISISGKMEHLLGNDNQKLITANLMQFLELTEKLTAHDATLAHSLDNLNASLQNIRTLSKRLPALADHFDASLNSLQSMATEIRQSAAALRKTVQQSSSRFDRLTDETRPGLQSLIDEMTRAAANLSAFSESLRHDPQILLYGEPPTAPGPGE